MNQEICETFESEKVKSQYNPKVENISPPIEQKEVDDLELVSINMIQKEMEKTVDRIKSVCSPVNEEKEDEQEMKKIIKEIIVKPSRECDILAKEIYIVHKSAINEAVETMSKVNALMFKNIADTQKAISKAIRNLEEKTFSDDKKVIELKRKREILEANIEMMNESCTKKCMYHAVNNVIMNSSDKKK